tara:strand:- start:597 stop:4301 length:3705 start_codon:yes stop_codon:yes gene_type:complete
MAQKKDNYFYGEEGTQGLPFYKQVGLGVGSGGLKIIEGIAELGAGVSDYAFDTDLLKALEENYPKINVNDGLGKLVETIIQYGVPYSGALSIASKISKIKNLGQVSNATGISKVANKIAYYGVPAAIVEPIVSTSRDATIGQALGLYPEEFMKKLDPTQYEGRERAAAQLQQKLLFGLEAGPTVGGITVALNPLLKGAGKVAATVGGPVVKGTGNYVLNPLAKVISSKKTGIPQVIDALGRGRVKVGEKLGLPEYQKWRIMDPDSSVLRERAFAKLDKIVAPLRTSGPQPVEFQPIKTSGINYAEGFKKRIDVISARLDKQGYELAKKLGKEGKQNTKMYADNLMEDVMAYISDDVLLGSSKFVNVPKNMRNNIKLLKNEFTVLRKHLTQVLEPDEIKILFKKDLNKYFKRTYDITENSHFKVKETDRIKVARQFMKMLRNNPDYKNLDTNVLKYQAINSVDSLINLGKKEGMSTENLITESAAFIKNKVGDMETILKKGEDLPKLVRTMFGDTTNARGKILETVTSFAQTVGRKDTFDNIARNGLKSGWLVEADDITTAIAKFQTKTGVRNTNLVQVKPDNAILGKKVENLWTTKAIANGLKQETLWTDFLLKNSIYKSFLTFKGASQMSKTVLSPTTQIRNVESAAMFAMANGHFGNGASLSQAMKMVFTDVFGPDGKVDLKLLADKGAEYRRFGVTNSNVVVREVQGVVDDLFESTGDAKKGYTETMLKNLQEKSILPYMTRLYQAGDDLWKIYGYEFEKSKFLNIIKEGTEIEDATRYFSEVFGRRFDKFLPDGKTLKSRKEIINETASEVIKNTYPNYSYVPSLVQNLRRLPLGNFISFPAEMYRTSFNLMKFGLREMRSGDDLVRESGARKLLGFSSALATGKIAQEIGKEVVGITNEQMDAMRESFVAPWNKSGPLVPISKKKDADGNVKVKFVNFAYQSPYDVLSAPYYAAMTQFGKAKAEEKDLDQALLRAFFGTAREPGSFTVLVQPFIGEAILTEKLADLFIRGGKTRGNKQVYSSEDSVSDVAVKGVFHLLNGLTPGAFTQVTNMARGVAGEQTKYGKEMNASDEALALFAGMRINEANVKQSLGYAISGYSASQREARKLLTKNFAAANLNAETVYNNYEKLLANRYENFGEIRKVFKDAETLDFSRGHVMREIKKRITKKDQATIFSGVFISEDFGKLFKDERLEKTLQGQGKTISQFIDMKRMIEIFNKYNGKKFAEKF